MQTALLRFIGWEAKDRITKPHLRLISPLSYYVCWCYVFLNTCMGLYLLHNFAPLHLVVVNHVFTFQLWALVFLFLAISMTWSLLTNQWKALRWCMMLGFMVKFFWGVALIFMVRDVGIWRILASMGMWFTLAAIQAFVMVYLYPKEVAINNVERAIN